MMNVAILPVPSRQGQMSYRAIAGKKQSSGLTPGAALDALTAQFSADELGTLVIVQTFRPDEYFTESQQYRLEQLMDKWRTARDKGQQISPIEQAELEALVNSELYAATARAATLADTVTK